MCATCAETQHILGYGLDLTIFQPETIMVSKGGRMQNKYNHKMLVVLLIFSSICFAVKAGLPELKPRTKTIAVFKNGLGFFIKEGKVTLKDGWAQTELVPRASLGSM